MAASARIVRTRKISDERRNLRQTLTAVGDVTDWFLVTGDIAVQLTGVATAVTGVVERSTLNPDKTTVNPAPVDDPITGNASTGIKTKLYYEPGYGWWRVRLTALTGASVSVALSGATVQ